VKSKKGVQKMRVYKQFTFDAAHSLGFLPDDHKCKRLHGHTYHVEVLCEVALHDNCFELDYADITEVWERHVQRRLDHRNLNEVLRFPDSILPPATTCENVARWIWEALAPHLPLARIRVGETATAGVEYEGR
jgi:6-pyruvoyltetrahydropterin/6-carboxytetrahydropterin synthase